MKLSFGLLGIAASVAVALFACSSDPVTVGPVQGAEGGACYPNSTCNNGLSCYSKLCVADPGSDAGTGMHLDSGADASVDPAVDQAAAAYAKAYCDKAFACVGSFGGFVDAATCEARLKLSFVDQLVAPGDGWTPPAFTTCANKIATATCHDWWAGLGCSIQTGKLPTGGACDHNSQCESFACLIPGDNVCGKCVTASLVGMACTTTNQCAGNALCISGTCVVAAELGAACGSTQPCAFGLACRAGTCASATAGEACSPAAQDCQVAYFCNGTTSLCEEDHYAAPGAPCGFVSGGTSVWRECLVGQCAVPGGQMMSTCPDVAMDGQPCSNEALCVYPAVCSGGACTMPNAGACK